MWHNSLIYKCTEFEIYFHFEFEWSFLFNIKRNLSDDILFLFNINLFNMVELFINKSKDCDHAGTRFTIMLFGLELSYTKYDTRHWDDKTNDWCKY